MFAKDIRQHCTCGGRGVLWARAVQCCLVFFFLIRAMNTARRRSKKRLASFCLRCKDKLDPKMTTFENLSSSSLVILPIGIFRQTVHIWKFHAAL